MLQKAPPTQRPRPLVETYPFISIMGSSQQLGLHIWVPEILDKLDITWFSFLPLFLSSFFFFSLGTWFYLSQKSLMSWCASQCLTAGSRGSGEESLVCLSHVCCKYRYFHCTWFWKYQCDIIEHRVGKKWWQWTLLYQYEQTPVHSGATSSTFITCLNCIVSACVTRVKFYL